MRRKAVAAVLALLLRCALSYAQTGSTGPRAYDPNTPKHSVSGSVVNSATGEPIPRALVQIMGALQQADLTDSQGSFRFDDVPEGRAVFMVRKPGFFSPEEMSRGGGRPRTSVTINADTPLLVLKLTPEGIVTGTITGEDGEPLEGVLVWLKRQTIANGRKRWETRSQTHTDENGGFRLANLVPGKYFLAAKSLRAATPRAEAENVAYPPTYFPGAPDLGAASPLEVRSGQSVQFDMRLRSLRVHELSGLIVGAPPDRGVNLQFSNRSGDEVASDVRYNSIDGTFHAKVPAGTYTLQAKMFEPPRRTLAASITLTVAANLTGMRLPLQPAASIPVVVRTDFTKQQGSGISNAGLKESGPRQYVSLQLTGVDGTQSAFSNYDPKDSNGPLLVQNLEAGRYAVQISPHGAWYVQSATHGQEDLLREPLVVGQGGEQRPIEIVLRDDGGSIAGSVTSDNNPVPAVVLVIPERRSTMLLTQYTSERGFNISNLAPGDYMLLAFDSADGLEYTNREALEPYLSRAAHVSVSSNGSASVTLTMIKRGEP